MSIVFFNNVLHALGKRINYDAVSNLAGNSFAKDAWKAIQNANPLIKENAMRSSGFLELINSIDMNDKKNTKTMDDILNEIGWDDQAKEDERIRRSEKNGTDAD